MDVKCNDMMMDVAWLSGNNTSREWHSCAAFLVKHPKRA